jgi:hypothetical protein
MQIRQIIQAQIFLPGMYFSPENKKRLPKKLWADAKQNEKPTSTPILDFHLIFSMDFHPCILNFIYEVFLCRRLAR